VLNSAHNFAVYTYLEFSPNIILDSYKHSLRFEAELGGCASKYGKMLFINLSSQLAFSKIPSLPHPAALTFLKLAI